jgi:hypothetical protein
MGLDGLELILEVEESFGISISDDEAAKIDNVGKFYETILSKLPAPEENSAFPPLLSIRSAGR